MTTVPVPAQLPAPAVATRRGSSSFWRAAWYRYRRNKLALVAGAFVIIILLTGILAPLISPYSETSNDLTATLSGAGLRHWLGTDQLGRDTLTRVIWGARTSMTVAVGATAIGAVIGIPIGILAGWFGGGFDWVALRLFELFTMVPTILAALLFITVFGVNIWKLSLFIGFTLWVGFGRLMRGAVPGPPGPRVHPGGAGDGGASAAHHRGAHPPECRRPDDRLFRPADPVRDLHCRRV